MRRRKRPSRQSEYKKEMNRRKRQKKVLKLDLRKVDEFVYRLNQIIADVEPEYVGTLKGSIVAKAKMQGIDAARDFVREKMEEGIITEDAMKEIHRLLKYSSAYR